MDELVVRVAALEAMAEGLDGRFTWRQVLACELTEDEVRWRCRPGGPWIHDARNGYAVRRLDGGAHGVARSALLKASPAAILGPFASAVTHRLDVDVCGPPDLIVPPSASGRRPNVARRLVPDEARTTSEGLRMLTPAWTLALLAQELDHLRWEWALESALFHGIVTIDEVALAVLALPRVAGPSKRMVDHVLEARPAGARPTESRLEICTWQLVRDDDVLRHLTRQVDIYDGDRFEGRADFVHDDLPWFLECDGKHHDDQPDHDLARQRAIERATSFHCDRLRWKEVVLHPRTTLRELRARATSLAAGPRTRAPVGAG